MKKLLRLFLPIIATFILAFGTVQAVTIFTVPQGGTGVGTITGLVKGNGTSAFTAATPDVDYLTPGTATTTYVPYTGATSAVDLGGNSLSAAGITTAEIHATGGGFLTLYPGGGTGDSIKVHNDGGVDFMLAFPAVTGRGYTFPNDDGTIALGIGTAGNCAQWSTANVLTDTGSPCGSGGGGSPGGLNTQIQYNNNGVFGGITGAVTDGTAVSLTAPHLLNPTINGAGVGLATLVYPNTASNATITVPATTGTLALTSQLTSGTVTSVSGTTNRITVATGTTTPVIDISASYVGQSSITTLGTITTGVWNGTAIANANLANSSLTIGSTNIALGATSTTLAGLSSITSTSFVGALTGNASTATALATGRTIGIVTGDATSAGSSFDGTANNTNSLTLATVNSNVGSFGSSTSIPSFTVNAKGLITAASGNVVVAPAGTLSGTTLNSSVVTSSLTSVGTLGSLIVTGNITNSALTASKVVFTDGSKNLTSTGIGTSSQFIKADGSLDSTTYGSGTVTSVSGTTNRITVATGTTTPVIDISATFEALLGKVANPLSQFASTTSLQLLGVISDETGSGALTFATNPTFSGITIADATNIVLNTTTGTKFGTSTSQKLAFYNSTPIVQPTGNIITALSNLGLVGTPTLPASSVSSGAALTKTDDTNVTLTLGGTPTSALLASTSLTLGWTGQLSLARGGLNANLTASNGGIFYSTGSAGAILAGTATAGQILQSGASTTPSWSTATYPSTAGTSGNVLTSNGTNWVSSAPPASGGVPYTLFTADFRQSGSYGTDTGPSGSVNYGNAGAGIATGSSGSWSALNWNLSNVGAFQAFNGTPEFSATIYMAAVPGTASHGQALLGIGQQTSPGTSLALTNRHIAIKLLSTGSSQFSVYGSQADNSTESATSALTTVVAGDVLEISFKVNASSVDYYWRKNGGSWSSATNLTGSMPSASFATNVAQFIVNNQGQSDNNQLSLGTASYKR